MIFLQRLRVLCNLHWKQQHVPAHDNCAAAAAVLSCFMYVPLLRQVPSTDTYHPRCLSVDDSVVQHGMTRQGKARRGKARQGKERQGTAAVKVRWGEQKCYTSKYFCCKLDEVRDTCPPILYRTTYKYRFPERPWETSIFTLTSRHSPLRTPESILFLWGSFFFPVSPGFEPTYTRLISGQSTYYRRPQSHSSDSAVFSALLTVSYWCASQRFSLSVWVYHQCFFCTSIIFIFYTGIRTNAHQAQKRTVYPLDRKVIAVTLRSSG